MTKNQGHNFEQLSEEMQWLLKNMTNAFVLYEAIYGKDGQFLDCRYLFINDAYKNIFNIPAEKIIGKTHSDVWGKGDSPLIDHYEQVAIEGITANFELFHEPSHKYLKFNVYRPWQGHQHFCVVFEDITEQKQADEKIIQKNRELEKASEALIQSENKFRLLFESANDAIFILEEGRFVDTNAKTLDLFQTTMPEMIGRTPWDFSPLYQPDGQSSVKKAKELIKKTTKGQPNSFEWLHLRKDGTTFEAEINLNAFNLNDRTYIQAIVRDITSRKEALRALEQSENKFRNIFNNSSDAIVISDLNQQFREINNRFINILGFNKKEFYESKTTDIIAKDYREKILERNKQLKQGKTVPDMEVELITKDKKRIPVEINSQLINYNEEKAILTVVRDIRERKELQQKIIDTMIETEERERQKMAQDLHDDLGPLLSTMNMYLQALLESDNKETQKTYLKKIGEIIQESIANVRQISNDLSPYTLNNFGLKAALESRIDRQQQFINIRFNSNIDKTRFSNVIETIYYRITNELINNTLKHAKADKIIINLNYESDMLILEYNDNGVGFDVQKMIDQKKEGIGLSSILSRAKSLGSQYEFYSTPNKGMQFILITKTTIEGHEKNNHRG